MTLEEFELGYAKQNRSERLSDYGTGILVLIFAVTIFYKGFFGSHSNSVIYCCIAALMLIVGLLTLWSVVKKYEIIKVPIDRNKSEHIALIENIAAHYSEKPVRSEAGHLKFWIYGGLSKISYIVEMYATEDQVLYNLRMSRGIIDVFGSARKKRKEIEELLSN
ncbi:hypothetical protein [Pedobacter sp. GR22-6]|uniref:hypothetical protein n=1 Tax=Pedobacter sp. GR22-6 TaxID=3127957 RepID=UPI00307D1FF2